MPDNETDRGQFTFYRSYFDALRTLSKKDRLAAYEAIAAYALDGTEPVLTGPAATAFILIRPTLDTGRKRAKSGKQGGSKTEANGEQTESKPEASAKRGIERSEKEGEKEKEKEIEKEGEKDSYTSQQTGSKAADADEGQKARSRVMTAYMAYIQALPPSHVTEALKGYTAQLGPDVVCFAIDKARANNVPRWDYIQAILADYAKKGVTDMAAVEREEAAHRRRKESAGRKPGQDQKAADTGAPAVSRAELDDMRKMVEKMKGGGG